MTGFYAFLKKEMLEHFRTLKGYILLAVFFLFGMMSPLLAKILPDIISSMPMEGMQIVIPDPTSVDAYAQFFKNVTQMGIVVILLIFSGMISAELAKGTLVNVLAKGFSRKAVLLSKYTVALLSWTICYVLSSLTCYGYTYYLFGAHAISNLIFAFFCLWIFGAFVLALILFTGTLVNGNYGGLLLSAAILGILLIIQTIPKISKFIPSYLTSKNVTLLTGDAQITDLMPSIVCTVAVTIACIVGSMLVFQKKKL